MASRVERGGGRKETREGEKETREGKKEARKEGRKEGRKEEGKQVCVVLNKGAFLHIRQQKAVFFFFSFFFLLVERCKQRLVLKANFAESAKLACNWQNHVMFDDTARTQQGQDTAF